MTGQPRLEEVEPSAQTELALTRHLVGSEAAYVDYIWATRYAQASRPASRRGWPYVPVTVAMLAPNIAYLKPKG